MEKLRALIYMLYKAGDDTVEHDGIEHSGYLAFLGLLAMFPFMVFLIALAGFVGQGSAGTEFIELVFSNLPPDAVAALRPRVAELTQGPPQGLLTISILGAIWTSSSAVEGYRTVLNRAYRVGTPPAYIWRRLMSIGQLLVFSFLIIIGMLMLVFAPLAWDVIQDFFGEELSLALENRWRDIIFFITLAILYAVVVNMYYILPNIKQNWHSTLPGAAVTVALWMLAAKLFSIYLSNFDQVNLIYGSLGGIIAALVFFYIVNVIFIFGAELNYRIKKALGEEIEQKEDTVEKPEEDPED